MFQTSVRRLLLTTVLALPISAVAQDAALILGNERYEQLDRVNRADDLLGATDRLEALGFDVASRANGRVDAVKDLAAAFQVQADGADRLVVALSGHFVTDGTRTWLLTAEAIEPELFTIDGTALSLDSVLRILAARPGKAVLLMGAADPDDLDMDDSGLMAGVGDMDIPQGVTVLQTTPSIAASTMSGVLTEPEATIGQQIAANSSIISRGYLPRDWVLMPGEVVVDTPTPTPSGPSEVDLNAEAALWDRTTSEDSVQAYRAYVARYPEGRFTNDAEAQIEAILAEPNRAARLSEEALNLTRAARREVQSNLTLLNYNTRGVDGIFGSGSRGAILNWQQSNGFPQSSYLTRDQIDLLDAQASRRQAEIDAEEARAVAQAEARDRSYWTETGGVGDEAGYRAYLARFPEGLFSGIAKARIEEIEDRRRTAAEAQDRAAWSIADSIDSVAGYQEYLAAYPSGVFADQANARIAEMNEPQVSDTQIARAQAEENNLRLSGVRAQLLELRLRDMGLNPGRLDGVIDENTRRAISAYQDAQGLTATGYVDQATAVGLMTGSISITVPGR
ncbi:Putative peptidoglycan binding domain-containing protein [Octadecabacter temperatus]|uniref:Putative peptidoglycan binding domain protein n=1 Tax=Octadecabacter temperatus TaxID=1458307 RepID=A0A0K0Y968_9RHOB|nr:peptidoglycan-binding protein [Octadecabacter temperatus]AKS47508.1 Putative peptidoglycan binding domain protein [Octadecabacter temperatus]SIO41886.1 Putative peptidoglycan binding domain-containing protein [Octadecabacter temperatus]